MGNYTTLPIIADSFVKIGGDGNNLLLEEMVARKEEIEFTPKTIELDTEIIERESSVNN